MYINYWHKEMIYPFTRKFLLYDDIKESLTGYARIVSFRCFFTGTDGLPDPTADNVEKYNWIMTVQEGGIKNGQIDGFNRIFNCYNGFCTFGYYKNGQEYGKYKYFDNFAFVLAEGNFMGTKLVEEKVIDDFYENFDMK